MIAKTVKVTAKGQISIPIDIRELAEINTGDELIIIQEDNKIVLGKPENVLKDNFRDLLVHSASVARKLWDNKEDEIWDTL